MYGILHIPTGKFLARPMTMGSKPLLLYPIGYLGRYAFYSKKDAEQYKRAFLVYYYWYLRNVNPAKKIALPKRLPKYLTKRNKMQRYPFTFADFDLVSRSLDFCTTPTDGPLLPNEFLVIRIS